MTDAQRRRRQAESAVIMAYAVRAARRVEPVSGDENDPWLYPRTTYASIWDATGL
jgi:hypothetical protein